MLSLEIERSVLFSCQGVKGLASPVYESATPWRTLSMSLSLRDIQCCDLIILICIGE